MRHFLRSKPSYTKYTPATGKFKRKKAFASVKIEIWCLNLAYPDELAKDSKGVKYLLVRQDLIARIVVGRRMKTKDSKKMVRAFLTMITNKN